MTYHINYKEKSRDIDQKNLLFIINQKAMICEINQKKIICSINWELSDIS